MRVGVVRVDLNAETVAGVDQFEKQGETRGVRRTGAEQPQPKLGDQAGEAASCERTRSDDALAVGMGRDFPRLRANRRRSGAPKGGGDATASPDVVFVNGFEEQRDMNGIHVFGVYQPADGLQVSVSMPKKSLIGG